MDISMVARTPTLRNGVTYVTNTGTTVWSITTQPPFSSSWSRPSA